jgi:hypothetical protein
VQITIQFPPLVSLSSLTIAGFIPDLFTSSLQRKNVLYTQILGIRTVGGDVAEWSKALPC